MQGRTAAGLVLIVIGVAVAMWGFNVMNSLGAQIAGAIGMRDNTGPIAVGAGIILGVIGVSCLATNSSTEKR